MPITETALKQKGAIYVHFQGQAVGSVTGTGSECLVSRWMDFAGGFCWACQSGLLGKEHALC